MTEYRLYAFENNNHIVRPPVAITAGADEDAVRQAKQLLGDKVMELWNGARLVARLSPEGGPTSPKE